MDVTSLIVTIGGVALMVLTLWFFFGKRPKSQPTTGGTFYSCPMHPWITGKDSTSICSICGMNLVMSDGEHKSAEEGADKYN